MEVALVTLLDFEGDGGVTAAVDVPFSATSFWILPLHGGTATSSSAGWTDDSGLVWSFRPFSFSDRRLPPGESGELGDNGASPRESGLMIFRPPVGCSLGK